MNKYIIIGIGAIVFIGLIVGAFWLLGSGSQAPAANSQSGSVGFPVANSAAPGTTNTVTQGATRSVAGVGGAVIQTLDFIADPTTVKDPINPGYYYLGYHINEGVSDSTATDNPPYTIAYISATQYFNITLLQEPIGATRGQAEQYLIAHLGISQNQMCQFNYMVSVPSSVNSQFAGKNLGFSFCPGATVLPQ